MELYMRIRMACIETPFARCFHSVPLGYRRNKPPRRPKIGPYTGVIDWIVQDDPEVPKKQLHTANRIYERLRDEREFKGKYTSVISERILGC